MINKLNKQSGFTLLEVVVSILLFAIGILGMMGLQVLATRGAAIGNNNTVANYLAQSQANQLEALPITATALQLGSHGYGYTGDACLLCANCGIRVNELGTCIANDSTNLYSISWVVTPYTVGQNSTQGNLKSIAMTVSWASGNFTLTLPAGHY